MRILITNDDGIYASGMLPLVQWATKLGEVTVVAPKVEQSGKSHGIEIHKAFEVKQIDLLEGVCAYAVDSTPADCVRFAVLGMKKEFDLVISGINRGLNIGQDIMYSGTVGAVFEAAAMGIKAMAVSTEPKFYDRAAGQMDRVWAYMTENKLFDIHPIYNVNFTAKAGPVRITCQGGPYYSDEFKPQENDMFLPCGKDVFKACGNMDLDTDAVLSGGYTTIMPLSLSRADRNVFAKLKK
jgi:5'-nucleotidase